MIPLSKDEKDLPRWVQTIAEHCCFCAAPTRLWFVPKDVAVCASCGETREPDEVPTKEVWWNSPQAQGIAPDVTKEKTMTDLFDGKPTRSVGLVVNAPAIFARPDFLEWLNAPENRIFTWHPKGTKIVDEYADTIVLVDSNYEGDSSDMPKDIWQAICNLAYAQYGGPERPGTLNSHIAVRLTNMAV